MGSQRDAERRGRTVTHQLLSDIAQLPAIAKEGKRRSTLAWTSNNRLTDMVFGAHKGPVSLLKLLNDSRLLRSRSGRIDICDGGVRVGRGVCRGGFGGINRCLLLSLKALLACRLRFLLELVLLLCDLVLVRSVGSGGSFRCHYVFDDIDVTGREETAGERKKMRRDD